MAKTMKAITISSPGAAPQVTNNLIIPEPGEGQILVRSIYTAINPGDSIMAETGAMVKSWPFSPGCDAGGIVVSAGSNAVSPLGKPFAEGERVFGCTRLGTPGHSPWGEYFLMDSRVTIPVPPKLTLAEASALGVGLLTASEGVFSCLGVPLPTSTPTPTYTSTVSGANEPDRAWALVLGGASSVGFAAVQLLLASGLHVVTTCSERSAPLLQERGVSCISYRLGQEDLISRVMIITHGKVRYVFDAVGLNHDLVGLLVDVVERHAETDGGAEAKYAPQVAFTTTNAFAPLPIASNLTAKAIQLGPIGRPEPEAKTLNEALAGYIPVLYRLLDSGKVVVGPYRLEEQGVEGILGAWNVQKSGKVAGKIVVKVTEK
ncbi:GroES-like protein [Macroventuria anomochaeta]|uniref:GroES-like protein n=1 Tax=Macroventuria anomochaeta TaxID=301207 RepID=A0ACB6RH55_9PLEO|nr:GroES-like protein [Macroventuria anomochaeta]KAF2621206.1 GroES-like protein [Macroventuria anomochaeta]